LRSCSVDGVDRSWLWLPAGLSTGRREVGRGIPDDGRGIPEGCSIVGVEGRGTCRCVLFTHCQNDPCPTTWKRLEGAPATAKRFGVLGSNSRAGRACVPGRAGTAGYPSQRELGCRGCFKTMPSRNGQGRATFVPRSLLPAPASRICLLRQFAPAPPHHV
jgi:hypothetical protein